MIDLALDSSIFITNTLDAAVQEIDILFNTDNTELIGSPSFGLNFEQFLWQMNPSPESLRHYIEEHLNSAYYLQNLKYDLDVTYVEGEFRYIYNVSITVYDDNNNSRKRSYQLR